MPAKPTIPRTGARHLAGRAAGLRPKFSLGTVDSSPETREASPDFAVLLRNAAPRIPRSATERMHRAAAAALPERMAMAGRLILDHLGPVSYLHLARHRSPTVRGWAAYVLGAAPEFSLGERLQLIRVLANDPYASVRDWACAALRPSIAACPGAAIDLLEAWTVSGSPFLRRFACEVTRPRGSECDRLPLLERDPSLGLPLLEPLRADSHRYVRQSVSGWLCDAAVTQPGWVMELCLRWQKESRDEATASICREAMGTR